MLIETKNSGTISCFIAAHSFEYATSVMKCMGGDVRGGISPWNDRAVAPYPFGLLASRVWVLAPCASTSVCSEVELFVPPLPGICERTKKTPIIFGGGPVKYSTLVTGHQLD